MLVGRDAEVEVQCVGRQPSGDLFRPFDGEAPRRAEKFFDEQRIDLGGGFEAIGVEVNQRSRGVLVKRVDVESGTGHRSDESKAASEALHKGGFADAEIAVESEGAGGGQGGGELGGYVL